MPRSWFFTLFEFFFLFLIYIVIYFHIYKRFWFLLRVFSSILINYLEFGVEVDDRMEDRSQLLILIKRLDISLGIKLCLWKESIVKFELRVTIFYEISIAFHHSLLKLTNITVTISKDHHSLLRKKTPLKITINTLWICN